MNSHSYNPEEIKILHNICEDILDKIQTGVYPPFPELITRESDDDDLVFTKYNPLMERRASKIVDSDLPKGKTRQ